MTAPAAILTARAEAREKLEPVWSRLEDDGAS
jgi:hypothetical protein